MSQTTNELRALCYRLRTGPDERKWQWQNGEPSQGVIDLANARGYVIEYAYPAAAPAPGAGKSRRAEACEALRQYVDRALPNGEDMISVPRALLRHWQIKAQREAKTHHRCDATVVCDALAQSLGSILAAPAPGAGGDAPEHTCDFVDGLDGCERCRLEASPDYHAGYSVGFADAKRIPARHEQAQGGMAVAVLEGCGDPGHPCRSLRWLVNSSTLPPGTKLYTRPTADARQETQG